MNPLLLSLSLLLPAAPGSTAGVPTASPCDRSDEAGDVALDVEVLRRLLVQAVAESLPQDEAKGEVRYLSPGGTAGYAYNTLFSTGTSLGSIGHSRGYHVPGVGAVYSLDTTLPVTEVEPEPGANGHPESTDDAWRDMERAVLGGQEGTTLLGAVRNANEKTYAIDRQAIQAVRDAVLGVVADHGTRIDALTGDESIVVALHLSASNLPVTYRSTADDDEGEGKAGSVGWLTTFAAKRADPVRLVIRIRRADLTGNARTDREVVQARAEVLTY